MFDSAAELVLRTPHRTRLKCAALNGAAAQIGDEGGAACGEVEVVLTEHTPAKGRGAPAPAAALSPRLAVCNSSSGSNSGGTGASYNSSSSGTASANASEAEAAWVRSGLTSPPRGFTFSKLPLAGTAAGGTTGAEPRSSHAASAPVNAHARGYVKGAPVAAVAGADGDDAACEAMPAVVAAAARKPLRRQSPPQMRMYCSTSTQTVLGFEAVPAADSDGSTGAASIAAAPPLSTGPDSSADRSPTSSLDSSRSDEHGQNSTGYSDSDGAVNISRESRDSHGSTDDDGVSSRGSYASSSADVDADLANSPARIDEAAGSGAAAGEAASAQQSRTLAAEQELRSELERLEARAAAVRAHIQEQEDRGRGIADAEARIRREVRLREALTTEKAAAEAQIEALKAELRDLEVAKIVADRAAAENADIANQWKERSDAFEAAFDALKADSEQQAASLQARVAQLEASLAAAAAAAAASGSAAHGLTPANLSPSRPSSAETVQSDTGSAPLSSGGSTGAPPAPIAMSTTPPPPSPLVRPRSTVASGRPGAAAQGSPLHRPTTPSGPSSPPPGMTRRSLAAVAVTPPPIALASAAASPTSTGSLDLAAAASLDAAAARLSAEIADVRAELNRAAEALATAQRQLDAYAAASDALCSQLVQLCGGDFTYARDAVLRGATGDRDGKVSDEVSNGLVARASQWEHRPLLDCLTAAQAALAHLHEQHEGALLQLRTQCDAAVADLRGAHAVALAEARAQADVAALLVRQQSDAALAELRNALEARVAEAVAAGERRITEVRAAGEEALEARNKLVHDWEEYANHWCVLFR